MKIFIKRPGSSKRATYAIIVDNKTISDPRLDAINADLKAGHPPDTLELRLRSLIATLRGKGEELVPSDLNRKLVEQRHAKKLLRKSNLRDADGLKQRLLRAAAWIGELSIRESGEDELLARLREAPAKAQYELTRGVNELLRFAGRSPLPMPDKEHPEIAFIPVTEFLIKISPLPKLEKLYIASLFATGCRFSELPLAVFQGGKVVVKAAFGSRAGTWGKVQGTKNKHDREALILPPLLTYTKEFALLSPEEKKALWSNHKRLYLLCKSTFGIRLHDLRHSYAVAWGGKGIPVGKVAEWIGDSVEVTRRHYWGYFVSDDEVEKAHALWK